MKMRIATVAAASAVLMVGAAAKGGGQQPPFTFANPSGGGGGHQIIEKQNDWPFPTDPNLLIVNPGWPASCCAWDINDHSDWHTSEGYLAASTSVQTQWKHISDYNPIYRCIYGSCQEYSSPSNWHGATVDAGSPNLTVTLCFEPQNRCFSPSPVATSQNSWHWRVCAQAVYTPDDPALQDIQGSNAGGAASPLGRGVITTVTFKILNPSTDGRHGTVKNVSADWGLSSDAYFAPGCENHDNPLVDYPFRWLTS